MSARYSDQELLERVGHIAELERERDAIKAEAVRLSEVVHSLCSDEFAAAIVAWRGLTEGQREIVCDWIAGAVGAAPEARRLLKAAAR